jgi:DNA-binding NarL/FixJ family response regulator
MTTRTASLLRTKTAKAKVIVVDDHPVVRKGLSEMISTQADLTVCGEAADGPEALRLVKATNPDVVLIDLSLQGGHGIELIEQIHLLGQTARMLVVSVHDETLFAERVLRAGAMGYVSKLEPVATILEAIHVVLSGRIFLSPTMATRLLHSVVGGQPLERDPIRSLSNREIQVFEMIGEGMPTKRIAVKLGLSRKTIEAHREKIKTKLNLANSAELSRRAVQWVLENR